MKIVFRTIQEQRANNIQTEEINSITSIRRKREISVPQYSQSVRRATVFIRHAVGSLPKAFLHAGVLDTAGRITD